MRKSRSSGCSCWRTGPWLAIRRSPRYQRTCQGSTTRRERLLVGIVCAEPTIGPNGEEHARGVAHALYEGAPAFLTEVADGDGLSDVPGRRVGGVHDGALDDDVLVRRLFALNHQGDDAGLLDQSSLAGRRAG